MKHGLIKKLLVSVTAIAVSGAVQAGTFWFPIEAHYPYSSNLKVTAVPDLDPVVGSIKTRLFETGKKSNGCIAYTSGYPCTNPFNSSNSVWAYRKDGGGADWSFDGVPYTDDWSTSKKRWLWYDNHNGYDFVSKTVSNPRIFSVEAGVVCGYSSSWGQICIQHNVGGVSYQTWYTHMTGIPSSVTTLGTYLPKWTFLGNMGGTAPGGSVGVHLHFATKKLVGGTWVTVDPYGHKPNWPSSTADDPNHPYLWE